MPPLLTLWAFNVAVCFWNYCLLQGHFSSRFFSLFFCWGGIGVFTLISAQIGVGQSFADFCDFDGVTWLLDAVDEILIFFVDLVVLLCLMVGLEDIFRMSRVSCTGNNGELSHLMECIFTVSTELVKLKNNCSQKYFSVSKSIYFRII